MFKLYYHRYGNVSFSEVDSIEKANELKEYMEDYGEGFVDCLTDESNLIIVDYDAETDVVGREKPISRIGQIFKLEGVK